MSKPIVIFDLDGTLADCEHRKKYLLQKPKDWNAFFAEAVHDTPIEPMRVLNRTLAESGKFCIYICTGRHEGMRVGTEAWLKKHEIEWDFLLMRREKDFRQDFTVKKEMLSQLPAERVLFIIDDRNQAVEMWRREGFFCLQCADGDY